MNLPAQSQHRIPQVYQRQWCFRDELTNAETISVTKKDDEVSHYKKVKTFTAEENLFDTTLHDEGTERFFDEKCKLTETNYPKAIAALNAGSYDGQTRVYLTEFMSNLFVRQKSTYKFFTWIVNREHIRKKLFKEIALFEKDVNPKLVEAVYEEMVIDPDHSIDGKVSSVVLQGWKHFKSRFAQFDHFILKAPEDRAWFTSDNPVIVHGLGYDGWLIGDVNFIFQYQRIFLCICSEPTALNSPLSVHIQRKKSPRFPLKYMTKS